MKNHMSTLCLLLALTTLFPTQLLCIKKTTAPAQYTFDVNARFDEKEVQSALISGVGFVASVAALALMYKGTLAYSEQPTQAQVPTHNAKPLFLMGVPLLVAGMFTIVKPDIFLGN